MNTSAVFFPFDLFGSGGAGGGAELLADAVRELLADNRRETVPTRARAYAGKVRVREARFETLADYAGWREAGRKLARQALRRGDFLLWAAGNHLGVLPVYDELAGSGGMLVVQLDAHLDIHHFADCSAEPTHGNFLLHCAGPLPPVVNAGHRDLLLPPDYVAKHYRRAFGASELAIDPAPALDYLAAAARKAERVFLDVDCDVFDPAYFPAVTQPVPFGLSPPLVLRLIDAVWSPRVAGVLLSEFAPARDRDDRSLATLLWLVEYILLRRYEEEDSP
jgi:arginase family enzyme